MIADDWTSEGDRITDADVLSKLRRILEDESPVIIEHRFYRGARAPHRFVCDDPDTLEQYLRASTRAGDSFHVWHYLDCCRDDNTIARGKVPDAEGRTPRGGAY